MIRTLATALLALSLTASGAFATSIDDLYQQSDGLWHERFTDVPFTGKLDEGLQLGAFKNGKQEGPWVGYWDDGGLQYKGAFKNGKQEGPWVQYHEDGRLWYKGEYKNNKLEGPYVAYWREGQLMSKGAYKNGKEEGTWVVYRKVGSKNEDLSGTFRNGKKISD